MATHSSILAWRIPWTEEPGGCREKQREVAKRTPLSTHTRLVNILTCRMRVSAAPFTYAFLFNSRAHTEAGSDASGPLE